MKKPSVRDTVDDIIKSEYNRLTEEVQNLRQRNDVLEDLVIAASEFKIGPHIYVQERGQNRWCVFWMGDVLNSTGEWEWEPLASSRSDEFIERTRFDRDTALRLAKEKVNEKHRRSNPGPGSAGKP